MLTRTCPNGCGAEIYYGDKQTFRAANKRNSQCKACRIKAMRAKRIGQVPWNKGVKGYVPAQRLIQKTCGVTFHPNIHLGPLPVSFKGMNTAPRG